MTSYRIVHDGRLRIPLFHGTSTIWLSSIEERGLGGYDPVEGLRMRELLQDLVPLCDRFLVGDEEWSNGRWVAELMRDQEVTARGFNYRHGSTYLTPSRQTATRYAKRNALGSELVSLCAVLVEKLRNAKWEPGADLQERLASFEQLMTPSRPIVIEVRCVPVAALRGEAGDDATNKLAWIQERINDVIAARVKRAGIRRKVRDGDPAAIAEWLLKYHGKDEPRTPAKEVSEMIDVMCQQHNFELVEPIDKRHFTVHECE
jgi:hypothetical protein